MMTDKMIDEALVEILRTKRALEALRNERKDDSYNTGYWRPTSPVHAAAKRATLDLTRKLAQLRRGD